MTEQLIIVTAWIWGVKAVFTDPFILHKQGEWLDKKLPSWIRKPLFRCPVCMSSVWGTYFYFYFDHAGIMDWIIFVFALAGISYLLKEFLYPEE